MADKSKLKQAPKIKVRWGGSMLVFCVTQEGGVGLTLCCREGSGHQRARSSCRQGDEGRINKHSHSLAFVGSVRAFFVSCFLKDKHNLQPNSVYCVFLGSNIKHYKTSRWWTVPFSLNTAGNSIKQLLWKHAGLIEKWGNKKNFITWSHPTMCTYWPEQQDHIQRESVLSSSISVLVILFLKKEHTPQTPHFLRTG